jgi:hypothetical protein
MIQATTDSVEQAAVTCAEQCEHCSDMCIEESRMHCARTCRDCAQICWTTAAFRARHGTAVESLTRLCAEICRICAEECAQHDNAHCRESAELCRACASACESASDLTPRTPSGEAL